MEISSIQKVFTDIIPFYLTSVYCWTMVADWLYQQTSIVCPLFNNLVTTQNNITMTQIVRDLPLRNDTANKV